MRLEGHDGALRERRCAQVPDQKAAGLAERVGAPAPLVVDELGLAGVGLDDGRYERVRAAPARPAAPLLDVLAQPDRSDGAAAHAHGPSGAGPHDVEHAVGPPAGDPARRHVRDPLHARGNELIV